MKNIDHDLHKIFNENLVTAHKFIILSQISIISIQYFTNKTLYVEQCYLRGLAQCLVHVTLCINVISE
jgi:hypothetical protein